MENELKELKSVLRSLVVSSPTEVDLRTLLRDYRNMTGETIPLKKFGYRDALTFIKERCNDCFVIHDNGCNPLLILIVPESVKHIDNFVQRQKSSSVTRFKAKRRSVPESSFKKNEIVLKTFKTNNDNLQKTDYTIVEENKQVIHNEPTNTHEAGVDDRLCKYKEEDANVNNGVCSSSALHNFMKKRMPLLCSSQQLDSDSCLDKDSSKTDTDSGRQTSSSNSSTKRALLEELKTEIREIIAEVPEGVWCTDLLKLYRQKYRRELNFSRFGFTSVLSLAYAVEELQYNVAEHTGDLLLRAGESGTVEGVGAGADPALLRVRHAPPAPSTRSTHLTGDPDDALPGIDFDQDVFPRDSMHIMQSIPAQSLDGLVVGTMLEVVLGEVYSPTHFWMLRLGPQHYDAMEDVMDDMNKYYRGEGRERALAGGAVRVGHYCACCYHGDWHRAVIVKIIDSDTVKVRHVDYATVETVSARSLKPLLLRWATLPAQAMRARLAGVRPPAGGRRWPWAASAHFLNLIRDRQLVAYAVAKDAQEAILEVLLIDTSTEDDVCIGTEMCRSGHADPRPDSALGTSECYLFPRFDALETGDTPNYAEIYCYLRDGISLEFVEDYRRHVPSSLPPAGPRLAPTRHWSPTPASGSSSRLSPRPSPAAPLASPASLSVATARSLSRLAEEPPAASTQRALSLSPSIDAVASPKSVIVPNRIPLLRPELNAAPARFPKPERSPLQCASYPQLSQSMPLGGFPAAPFSPGSAYQFPDSSMNLSPYAQPFYPQRQQSYASQSSQPSHCPAQFPVFVPHPNVPQGGVSVPASECEIFVLVGRVDPAAAHRYMLDALSRAVSNTSVSCPPPRVSAETQTEETPRAPPVFGRRTPQPPCSAQPRPAPEPEP